MKYEILDRQSKSVLKKLNEELEKDKEKMEKISNQMKACSEFYMSQVAITGFGGIVVLLECLKFGEQRNVLQNFIEKKQMSEDLKEYLFLQKERYDLVENARKQGLKLDINPEDDLKSFLNGEKGFAPENFQKYFTEREDSEKYGRLTAKVFKFAEELGIKCDFFRKNLDESIEKIKGKDLQNAQL